MSSFVCLVLAACLQAGAPEPKQEPSTQDLQDQVDDLEKKVRDLERRQAQTTSANPLTVLNPSITVIGNFLWRLDNQPVIEDGEPLDDLLHVREVEVDMRAAIDPYADGVAIIALENEVHGELEVGIEEFYATIKSLPLPFWERPPLGTKLKVGRFRTEIGRNNRLHLHDLPQSNRPLVIEEFFGEEGHISSGGSAQLFLPSPGDTALELTVQALQGGGINVAQDTSRGEYLANLRLFVPLAEHHSFDVSLIGLYGTNAAHRQSRTWSVDLLYLWKPSQYQSLVVGGQVFAVDHEFHVELDNDLDGVIDEIQSADTSPMGFYVWAQGQLSRTWYVGVRFDSQEFLESDSMDRTKIQGYASWYLSEFFRVRFSVERTSSDDPEEDELLTGLLEINVLFGAHPPEPFWVNK